MNKWYMHDLKSVEENDKLLWDFEIQTDHQSLVVQKKKKKKKRKRRKRRKKRKKKGSSPADDKVKLKESEKRDKL